MIDRLTNKWPQEHIDVIKDLSISHRAAAEITGRTYAAVKAKRKALKIIIEPAAKDIDYYTPSEVSLIAANRYMSNPELAVLLGRSPLALSLKRQKLGLTPPPDAWTDEEINYLIDNYLIESKKEISAHLKRSIAAILSKANEIGISRKTEYWTTAEINALLENKDKSNEFLAQILNKTEKQIAYKKVYLKAKEREALPDLSVEFDDNIPFGFKSKGNEYVNRLGQMSVGQSFPFPKNEYQHIINAKKMYPKKHFRCQNEDSFTKRCFRLL